MPKLGLQQICAGGLIVLNHWVTPKYLLLIVFVNSKIENILKK